LTAIHHTDKSGIPAIKAIECDKVQQEKAVIRSLTVKQINFLVFFIFTLLLVLFALENTNGAVIQVIPGLEVEAPLSVELILAMGIGATVAWLFSVWTGVQTFVAGLRKTKQIQTLQRQVSELSIQVDERNKVLTSSPAIDVEVEEKSKN